MMKPRIVGLVLCGLLALTIPASARAQGLGGLIKKKIPTKIEQDPNADDPSQQGIQFNERVVELTAPVFKGFLQLHGWVWTMTPTIVR